MSATDHDVCKVCKKAHGHREPHQWGADSNAKSNRSNDSNADSNRQLDKLEADMLRWRIEVDVEIATLKGVVMELQQRLTAMDTAAELVSKAFDKTAYQREYMRAKRAKA